MAKPKLGKGLAALIAPGPAILSTKEAAAADETGAAMRIEQTRYERAVLDFESESGEGAMRCTPSTSQHGMPLVCIFQTRGRLKSN